MKKFIELIKKFWAWVVKTTTNKDFVFIFPLAGLGLLAFVLKSVLAIILLIIWVVTVVTNTNNEK
jgi:hypothetical protein